MELKYGSTSFVIELPPGCLAGVIVPSLSPPDKSPEEIINTALDACQSSLSQFKHGEKVVIVTSDITRYTGSEIYLPLLVERIRKQHVLQLVPPQAVGRF